MGSGDFRPELFTEPSEYEETPLRDRKMGFPNLYHDRQKAEFLRDVIALANTARFWGKPAYLLFGLDDQGNLCDISKYLEPYKQNQPVPKDEKSLTPVMERVRQQMEHLIRRYIAPPLLHWELNWGWRDDKLVAYFLVEPRCPKEPFHVAENLTSGGETLLSAKRCWIRSGESKREIRIRDLSLDSPGYQQVPFVAPSGWLRYFKALRANEDIARAADKYPYLDLYVDSDGYGERLEEVVRRFLDSEERILVIEGPPGSGKSTFLCRLVARWADAGIAEMEETRRREEFKQPGWIPVYLRLRERQCSDVPTLAKKILREADLSGRFWEREPSAPEGLLEGSSRWLICLDGVDELWEERQIEKCLNTIQAFTKRYKNVKILLTTRPVISIPDDMRTVRIAPLTTAQAIAYLRGFVAEGNETIYQQLEEGFAHPDSEWYQLKDICSVPLYLESLASLMAPDVPLTEPLPEPSPVPTQPDEETRDQTISQPHPVRWEEEEIAETPIQVTSQHQPVRWKEEETTETPTPVTSQIEEGEYPEETGPSLTIGWVLDRMIRKVWEREASRRPTMRINLSLCWEATGKLSLEMDGHKDTVGLEKAKRCYSSQKGLQWVLNLAILRVLNGSVAFSHSLFQSYFGAAYLKEHTDRLAEWESHCELNFWHSVMNILNQIQYSGGVL